jgi:hypothetical protein
MMEALLSSETAVLTRDTATTQRTAFFIVNGVKISNFTIQNYAEIIFIGVC